MGRQPLGQQPPCEFLLTGPVAAPRASAGYVFGLAVTAAALVLIPVVYMGLIGLVAYGVVQHAVHNADMLTRGARVLRAAAYAGPFVAGALTILFMLKPLFARPVRRTHPYSLDPAHEPDLYTFAGRIAAAIGAPAPRLIEVTGEPNAAASFRRGLRSLLAGDDLVLTVGTPLLAGFDTRQLAAVVAHELGHFSQRTAMRLGYLVRLTNAWLARLVYQRDAWDEQLAGASEHGNGFVVTTVLLSRLCIWISRRVLWLCMHAGHGVSCFMSRRMEYNADEFGVRLAGSDGYIAMLDRLQRLTAGFVMVQAAADPSNPSQSLCADVPQLAAAFADDLPPGLRRQVDERLHQDRTGLFSTHPALRDRIGRARRFAFTGVVADTRPASSLLRSYQAICTWTTLAVHEDSLGRKVRLEELVPVERIRRERKAASDAVDVVERFFQGVLRPEHLLFLDGTSPSGTDAAALVRSLRELRGELTAAAPEARDASLQVEEATSRLMNADAARALMRATVPIAAERFGLPAARDDAAVAAAGAARNRLQEAQARLARFDRAARDRLAASLALLRTAEYARSSPAAADLVRQAGTLTTALAALSEAHQPLCELRARAVTLGALLAAASKASDRERFAARVDATVKDVLQAHRHLLAMLRDHEHPLSADPEPPSIAAYVSGGMPPGAHPWSVCASAVESIDRIIGLYQQVMGRLAAIAERVERAARLAPLPAPPGGADG